MISAFNRLTVIFLALAILAGAIITVGVALHLWSADILLGWFEPQLELAADSPFSTTVAIVALSAIVGTAMIGLLIAEAVPPATNIVHTLSVTDEGTASIDNESLCLLAERTAETVHGVNDVHCYIRERNNGLVVRGRAMVALGANLLEITPELNSRIREGIEQLTGLKVETVNIKFKYQVDKRGRVSVR
ncbi:MAG: hypothetical protein ACOC9B_00400 [Chloroflexota bacterium]